MFKQFGNVLKLLVFFQPTVQNPKILNSFQLYNHHILKTFLKRYYLMSKSELTTETKSL